MIGLEPTFGQHLENLVGVFREIRRVLRADGTVWMNYGDAYAAKSGAGASPRTEAMRSNSETWSSDRKMEQVFAGIEGLKPKDLMMMPARVAMALQADGWYLRSEIIWHKPNPMPESARDRPTTAHEKIYLLSKSPRYFYDAIAVRTEMQPQSLARLSQPTFDQQQGGPKDPKSGNRSHRKVLENLAKRSVSAGWASNADYKGQDVRHKIRDNPTYPKKSDGVGTIRPDRGDEYGGPRQGFEKGGWDDMSKAQQMSGGANLRNVWKIGTFSYRGAHFSTFPPALVEPCIKAGTSEAGCCPECGAPWERVTVETFAPQGDVSPEKGVRGAENQKSAGPDSRRDGSRRGGTMTKTAGFSPTCQCDVAGPEPAVVLDCFGGAGTTALVADRLGRDAILIEISEEYADIARTRIRGDAPLLTEID